MRSLIVLFIVLCGIAAAVRYELVQRWRDHDFGRPVGLYHDGTSNLVYILNQRGIIYVANSEDEEGPVEVFLDIRPRVTFGGERGLLGLAFHPNYTANRYFFVNYINSGGNTVVSRFTCTGDPLVADEDSEVVFMTFNQPATNHNGGEILFGPDGFLYIAHGDGGGGGDPFNNGQNLNTPLGSILRVDINTPANGNQWSVPATNPWNGVTRVYQPTWAYGLRNPWRCSFDSNRLWCADVGQGAWEEIDIITPGGNYGWNIAEGNHCYSRQSCDLSEFVAPVHEYAHPIGRSITGGYVYRGENVPDLFGKYVFGDYETGRIWALTYDEQDPYTNSVEELEQSSHKISAFGVDVDGDLYLLSHQNGSVHVFVGLPSSASTIVGFTFSALICLIVAIL